MQDLTIQIVRKGPLMLFIMLISWLFVGALFCYTKINKPVKIHVEAGYSFPGRTHQTFFVADGKF